MQNYFAKMNNLSKNWENGLDIYIYIYYNDSGNVNKMCQNRWFIDEAADMQCVWR